MSLKNSSKISSFLFLIALLFVLALGSCAKTELDNFNTITSSNENKTLTSKEDISIDRSDDHDDDLVTDDEDDDEEEEDDKR